MSESLYRIEVTAAELDAIRLANILDRPIDATRVPQRKTATVTPPPTFNTGDEMLDAFMLRSWRPEHAVAAAKRRAAGLVREAPLKPRKWSGPELRMLSMFNERAIAAWRSLGHVVTITNGIPDNNGANVRVLPLGVSA